MNNKECDGTKCNWTCVKIQPHYYGDAKTYSSQSLAYTLHHLLCAACGDVKIQKTLKEGIG